MKGLGGFTDFLVGEIEHDGDVRPCSSRSEGVRGRIVIVLGSFWYWKLPARILSVEAVQGTAGAGQGNRWFAELSLGVGFSFSGLPRYVCRHCKKTRLHQPYKKNA
jgi:hypothetical protein